METKKLSAKEIEKEAAKFRKERADAPIILENTIAEIQNTLRKETREAQAAVAKVWDNYRIRALSLPSAQKQVDDIWEAHAQRKRAAAGAIKAAKSTYRATMNRKFQYAGVAQ